MLSGASTHILWIIENGFFTHCANHPYISTLFWDSLTFIDILAALALIIRPKTGVLLTLAIITIDVFHNNILVYVQNEHINIIGFEAWALKYWMLICQLLFMGFVFWTLKSNLKEINHKASSKNTLTTK
jgi:uncharacterized membrane protein